MPESEPQASAKDAKSSTDIWFGVKDARTRKIIQDRLAQRARREYFALFALKSGSRETDVARETACGV